MYASARADHKHMGAHVRVYVRMCLLFVNVKFPPFPSQCRLAHTTCPGLKLNQKNADTKRSVDTQAGI